MKIKSILAVIAALFVFSPAIASDRNIDVSVVLDLLDAGVSDASIERYVEKNDFSFELSSRDLKDLKKAGASDALVEFLQDREEDEYGDAEAYGVTSYPPSYYSYGMYYGDPYYSGFYYPYYYPYYGSYFHYGYRYPYYSGRGSRGGSGVVSHWYRNRSGGSTGTTTRSSPSRGSSSSHRGSSSQRGGGGGRRR
jgi:hypothetical protein